MARSKKVNKAEKSITQIILENLALLIVVEYENITSKIQMDGIVEKIKQASGLSTIQLPMVEIAIDHWVKKGAATLHDGYFQITRAGRAIINELADQASTLPTTA